ncbi:MAG: hypothetical protein AB1467_06460 [Candidatus Diapherotrites archaeon]
MIYSIINSIKLLATKPFYIITALVISIINAVLLFFVQDDLTQFLSGSLLTGNLPSSNITVLPYQVISMYPKQSIELIAVFFLWILLNVMLFFGFAHYSKKLNQKKANAGASFGFMAEKLLEAVKVTVFFFLIGALFATLIWFALVLTISNAILGIIALIILAIILLLVLIEFILTPAVMAAEELKLKEGLKETFAFSSKHSIEILILIIIIGVIDTLINEIIILIEDFSFAQNYWVQNGIEIIAALIVTSLAFLILTQFYLTKKKE